MAWELISSTPYVAFIFLRRKKMNYADGFLLGRQKIYTAKEEITKENIVSIVNDALEKHLENAGEESYLYWYRRGRQPVIDKSKEVRPEVNNKVVMNNAAMVTSFKNGYFLTKPVSYVARKDDDAVIEKVRTLNEYMYLSGKAQADNELVDWFHTVGLGVLYVEPCDDKDTPFKVYALDPRRAFVIYSLRPGERPLVGINVVVDGDYTVVDAYTEDFVYRLRGNLITKNFDKIVVSQTFEVMEVLPNVVGKIPLIEYQYNEHRMGAFEVGLTIMDAINQIESNRMDGIQQTVESLCVAVNCDFEEGTTANTIRQAGMIVLKSEGENKASFTIMNESLDQSQTQITLDNLFEQLIYKCAMPLTTKGGTSTSDTGTAVYLRDGWAMADSDARNTTDLYVKSNRYFDEVVLAILDRKRFKLKQSDYEVVIERNSTSNLIGKTQAALNMMNLGFSPEIVFERSGISSDPLKDIELSADYIEKYWKKGSDTPPQLIPFTGEETPEEEEEPMMPQENGDEN